MTATKEPRKSSTKGRRLNKAVNPLAKGQSCLTCRQRKVRCTAERPACQACLRTARFEGKELSTVHCVYGVQAKAPRSTKGKERAEDEADSEVRTEDLAAAAADGPTNLLGTISELLNSASGSEPAFSNTFGFQQSLPPPATSVEPAAIHAWPPPSEPMNATSSMFDHAASGYSSTPPLTYSSASSPTETAVSLPPTPSASPAPAVVTQAIAPNSSSYTPYFQGYPPMQFQKPFEQPMAALTSYNTMPSQFPQPNPYPSSNLSSQPTAIRSHPQAASRTLPYDGNFASEQQRFAPPLLYPPTNSGSFAPPHYAQGRAWPPSFNLSSFPTSHQDPGAAHAALSTPVPNYHFPSASSTLGPSSESVCPSLMLPPIGVSRPSYALPYGYPVVPKSTAGNFDP